MYRFILSIIFLVSVAPIFAWSATSVVFEESQGKTQFLAVGNPGFLKIEGVGKGPAGALKISDQRIQGEIKVELNSLDTGMSLRNRHMKEKYLKTTDYPFATLRFENAQLPQTWSAAKPNLQEQVTTGTLTIQKTSRPVEVKYSIAESGAVTAKFQIKITDFGIEIPSFMNVTVADSVDVEIKSKVTLQEVP